MLFLDSFPFVHADEGWLFSLTRTIIEEKKINATEDFFVLTERHPHAVKTVFHILQIPFVLASFSIYSARILSILFSVINLYFFYLLLKKNIKNNYIVIFILLIFSVDIQYLYISRFARQEIIILTLMTADMFLLSGGINGKKVTAAAVINGVAAGIHPNSFIIFTAVIFLMTGKILTDRKKIKKYLKYTLSYILIVALSAGFFVFLSLLMDNNFFSNYLQSGSEHGVADLFIIKILKLKRFYYKMYSQIAGTYYLPDVRMQLNIFLAAVVSAAVISVFKKNIRRKTVPVLFFAAGINAGFIIIGKYSPPSFSFIFPAGWYITALLIDNIKIKKAAKIIILTSVFVMLMNNSAVEIKKWKDYRYNKYMEKISSSIKSDGKIFGAINTSFFMNYKQLVSYNDIEYFKNDDNFFENFIYENKIKYILFTDELEIIYRRRPQWNDLYGNIYPFYSGINKFINEKCTLENEVNDRVYPVRIVDYMGKEDYSVKIYQVNPQ